MATVNHVTMPLFNYVLFFPLDKSPKIVLTLIKMTFLEDLRQAQSLDAKRKFGVGLVLLTTFFIGVVGAAFYWRTKQPSIPSLAPPPKAPVPTKKIAKTSLSLFPSKKRVKVGETFIVSLQINTGNNQIEAADAVLSFDPKVFEIVEVTQGEFFNVYPLKTIENGVIKISGAFGPGPDGKIRVPARGVGRFAKIALKALTPTSSTKITFVSDKTITASQGKNVLEETVEGEYIVE